MKNLDLISKRILVVSLSISAVLLSASLLIFSTRPANAQTTPSFSSRMDDGRRYDAVVIGSAMWIWNTQTGTVKRVMYTHPENSEFTYNYNLFSTNSTEKFW